MSRRLTSNLAWPDFLSGIRYSRGSGLPLFGYRTRQSRLFTYFHPVRPRLCDRDPSASQPLQVWLGSCADGGSGERGERGDHSARQRFQCIVPTILLTQQTWRNNQGGGEQEPMRLTRNDRLHCSHLNAPYLGLCSSPSLGIAELCNQQLSNEPFRPRLHHRRLSSSKSRRIAKLTDGSVRSGFNLSEC